MLKVLAIFIIALIIYILVACRPISSKDILSTKYNSTKPNEEYNVPLLTFKEADDILSSFLQEENRNITFIDNKLTYTLGNPMLKYNLVFEFLFINKENALFYLGSNKKIICDQFVCDVKAMSLVTKQQEYQCIVKGFLILNVEGEACMFPFTTTIDTNIKDTFKTNFDFKNNP